MNERGHGRAPKSVLMGKGTHGGKEKKKSRSKACLEGVHHLHCITVSLSVIKVVITVAQTMVA